MTHLEIYNEICKLVWGSTTPPASILPLRLSAGSTPENIANTEFLWRKTGKPYHQAESAVGTAFSSADTINTGAVAGLFWGVWLVQINVSGTISTKSPSSDQVYTSEALAIAALSSVDAGNTAMGYITIQSNTGAAWTAITDDLASGSDCNAINFYSYFGGDIKGSSGVIARARRQIETGHDYWYMETSDTDDIVAATQEYFLNYNSFCDNFKNEMLIAVYDSDSNTYRELEKRSEEEYTAYLKNVDQTEDTEYPLYYYIKPYLTTDTRLSLSLFPIPDETKTGALLVRYYAFSPALSNIAETWDAYEDILSIEAPELLIWSAVKDISRVQRDWNLYGAAKSEVQGFKQALMDRDWYHKGANLGQAPYKDF